MNKLAVSEVIDLSVLHSFDGSQLSIFGLFNIAGSISPDAAFNLQLVGVISSLDQLSDDLAVSNLLVDNFVRFVFDDSAQSEFLICTSLSLILHASVQSFNLRSSQIICSLQLE